MKNLERNEARHEQILGLLCLNVSRCDALFVVFGDAMWQLAEPVVKTHEEMPHSNWVTLYGGTEYFWMCSHPGAYMSIIGDCCMGKGAQIAQVLFAGYWERFSKCLSNSRCSSHVLFRKF